MGGAVPVEGSDSDDDESADGGQGEMGEDVASEEASEHDGAMPEGFWRKEVASSVALGVGH